MTTLRNPSCIKIYISWEVSEKSGIIQRTRETLVTYSLCRIIAHDCVKLVWFNSHRSDQRDSVSEDYTIQKLHWGTSSWPYLQVSQTLEDSFVVWRPSWWSSPVKQQHRSKSWICIDIYLLTAVRSFRNGAWSNLLFLNVKATVSFIISDDRH